MDNLDLNNRCYKTKDDKRHSTIWGTHSIEQETPEERELRLKILRENRGRWVWDEETRQLVRAEEYYGKKQDINAPQVSKWNDEWATLCAGRPMSKCELKRYCKENGKIWENG